MHVSTMVLQADSDVRRGFRLHVTNLEDRQFTYAVKYRVTPPDDRPYWASRLNDGYFAHVGSGTQSPSFSRDGGVYVSTTTVTIAAHQTRSVGLGPDRTTPVDAALVRLEGYVTIELPVLADTQGRAAFRRTPQSSDNVRVLLNPETTMMRVDTSGRANYIDQDGYVRGTIPVTRLNFDVVEALALASGKAENSIVPDGIRLLDHAVLVEAMAATQGLFAESTTLVPNASRADHMRLLVTLLCETDDDPALTTALNEILGENQSRVRLCDPRQ